MPDNAEKKNISKLDFNISDAISNLDKIDKKLKTISESSEAYAKKIGDNLGKTINVGNIFDVEKIKQDGNKTIKITKDMQDEAIKNDKVLKRNLILQNNQHNNKIEERNHRSMLKQEEDNNRLEKSTKTMYDKISEYAKTYVIYQGFNELRQSIKETIDEMVNVEYQMVQIDRVLSDSSLNIDKYRDKLIQLAEDYGNSFENVADITLRLAQAGFDAQESLMLTEKTLLALNTAELDATQATDDMVAVMAQWGYMTGSANEQAEKYGSIIDKINKVADNFPTTSEDILDALKKTSSAFNLAGASIDETIAAIVAAETASQRGGKVIGTALSNITQQLKSEGKLNLAEEMGLNFFTDANKTQFRPIMEIFQEMSERMQALKNEGKESSVEMQNLLEMFTVFRRNIGSSLLGEMAGEDSTYADALKTSLNSVGYSLQENTKHMQTAKAAQAQFNAELLKLKTQVWEAGLEDVFRDLLSLGKDVAQGVGGLIDKFGLLPVSVAAVTLAFTLLNKNTQASNWIGLKSKIEEVNVELAKTEIGARKLNTALKGTGDSFKAYVKSIDKGKASLMGYLSYQAKTTAQTIILTAKTIILQTVISGGITLAITALVGAIDKWINAEQKAIEANNKLIDSSKENAEEIDSEITAIQELRKEYEELSKKEKRTDEENKKIYEIQEKLNQLISDSGTQVELVTEKINEQGKQVQLINDKYDEQLSKIKSIEYEKEKTKIKELKEAAKAAQLNLVPTNSLRPLADFWQYQSVFGDLIANTNAKDIEGTIDEYFNNLDFNEQIKQLKDWKEQLVSAKRTGGDAFKWVSNTLEEMTKRQKEANNLTNEYFDELAKLYDMLGYSDTLSVSLQAIADSYNIEGPKKLIKEIQDINTEFSNGKINIEEYFNKIEEKINQIDLSTEGEELEAYQAIFAETTRSLAEGLEALISGLESGSLNFSDYSKGVKEAADNMINLRAEQNNLEFKDGVWKDAKGNVDEYTNSLQNAVSELEGMGELLNTIGNNYDYIAEHANAAGEAIFQQSEVGTEAYNNLANGVALSLNKMKEDNSAAYKAITDDIFAAMGASANEVANADAYITEALNGNAQALNAALNASASQVAASTNKVTTSMGKVLSELGKAISGFKYNITATPFIGGKIGLETDEKGIPKKLNLPSFGFDITGTGGDSIKNLGTALESFGADITEYGSNQFTYTQLKSKQQPYKSTGGNSGNNIGSKKGGGGSSSSINNAEKEAQKAEEEAYKARLKQFEGYIDEKERLEKRWVDKQKELGLLSNNDFMYITQQRIDRYKKYLEELKKATWMNAEDRLRLEKEYSEKIEDLQVDYIGYLEDQLDDEIKALEDANKKKIELIEKEADARIKALEKVSDANDRIREEEEYKNERQTILDEISYWQQRTGREAQEALIEAKKKLEELDKAWKETQEDWTIEDEIKKIEEERDAEINAIEAAQEAEIKAMQDVFDAKVKMFAETGEIIYEGTVIQAQSLYNAYKANFIDPITEELQKMNQQAVQATPTPPPAEQIQQYETYLIKSGDTLSKIAKRYGTTVEKIMAANPYVTNKNKIYAGKTLQIPKFHEGGIFGGNYEEGLALLKRGEVILKPSWSASLDRMMRYFDNLSSNNQTSITNGPTINVDGDLIRIEASIKNQSDIDKLEKKIEKMLKDKFNIKK